MRGLRPGQHPLGRRGRRGRPRRDRGRRHPRGRRYLALQDHLLELRDLGVVLAVGSKNRTRTQGGRSSASRHAAPPRRLRGVRRELGRQGHGAAPGCRAIGIGLDSLVLLDDNPAERALVRRLVPEVAVIELPPEPSGYVRALARYPLLEQQAVTEADAARTASYQARARARLCGSPRPASTSSWRASG